MPLNALVLDAKFLINLAIERLETEQKLRPAVSTNRQKDDDLHTIITELKHTMDFIAATQGERP
jgi:hypothetical protein